MGKICTIKILEGINKQEKKIVHYPASLNNSIFTDYLNFYLYRDGQLVSMLKKIILWYYVEVESKSQFKDLNNIINSLSPAQYHFGNTCPRN